MTRCSLLYDSLASLARRGSCRYPPQPAGCVRKVGCVGYRSHRHTCCRETITCVQGQRNFIFHKWHACYGILMFTFQMSSSSFRLCSRKLYFTVDSMVFSYIFLPFVDDFCQTSAYIEQADPPWPSNFNGVCSYSPLQNLGQFFSNTTGKFPISQHPQHPLLS